MARSRKRYYNLLQPGLFDMRQDSPDETEWIEGRIIAEGGTYSDNNDDTIRIAKPVDSRLRFMSFGSGSSGNSAYLGTGQWGIIIDAGVDAAYVESQMNRNGININNVQGILITHDHYDHVSNAYRILRNNHQIALFCTPKTLNGMLRRHGTSRRIKDYHHPIYKETAFNIRDFRITPFEVLHDGTDNVGYMIEYMHHNFIVAPDMGEIGERAVHYLRQATSIMIESDYDQEMLTRGRYPEHLKSRIRSQKGHLDNIQTALFLRESWSPSMTHIFLCHLSKDNNTPQIALTTVKDELLKAGVSKVGDGSESLFSRDAPVQLYALPRFECSPLFHIL